jgi:L-asparaginase / beta-aspartyl-peptidase
MMAFIVHGGDNVEAGESIIKVVLAKTVVDLMEYNGGDPVAAAVQGIDRLEKKVKGYGGVLVLNREGVPAVAFNTPRMARAYCTSAMASAIIEV